jgi:hypothetical protein
VVKQEPQSKSELVKIHNPVVPQLQMESGSEMQDIHSRSQAEYEILKNITTFNVSETGTVRISFFKTGVDKNKLDFLGYAVVRSEKFGEQGRKNYIYEAVLRPHREEGERDYLHCKRKYKVEFKDDYYIVEGTMYCQKNGKTSVCSHVALRTVLSLFLEDDISYAEINEMANIQPNQYPFDGQLPFRNGLQKRQIEEIFKKMKEKKGIDIAFELLPIDKDKQSFTKLAYGYIESGCPCLLTFQVRKETAQSESHIIPILGHTFDADSCLAYAKHKYGLGDDIFYQSCDWVSAFLMHDDNFGAYHTVRRSFVRPLNDGLGELNNNGNLNKTDRGKEEPNYTINENEDHYVWGLATQERKGSLYSYEIKNFTVDEVQKQLEEICKSNVDVQVLKRALKKDKDGHNSIILRSVFVEKQSYKIYLRTKCDIEENEIENITNELPNYFWMIEISCPELFSQNRKKFGELLFVEKEIDDDFFTKGCLVADIVDTKPEYQKSKGKLMKCSIETLQKLIKTLKTDNIAKNDDQEEEGEIANECLKRRYIPKFLKKRISKSGCYTPLYEYGD